MRGGQYEKVVVEGKWERNAPACTNCSFGKPVQFLDGDSDWCGEHLLSIKGIFFFRFFHGRVAKLRFGLRRSYFGSLRTENIADIVIGTERSHIDPVFEKRFIGSPSTGFRKSLIFHLFVD